MSKPIDQERAQFDKWLSDRCVAHVNAGEYEAAATLRGASQVLYVGWQARASVQPAGGAVPEGWKLVPVEPTHEMDLAGIGTHLIGKAQEEGPCHWQWTYYGSIYRAMLAAAPHPVSGEQPQVLLDDDAFVDEFMTWWEAEGQLVRSGGGDYERAFAFEAWRHLMPKIVELQTLPAAQDVAGLAEAVRDYLSAVHEQLPNPLKVTAAMLQMKKALSAHRAQQGEQP